MKTYNEAIDKRVNLMFTKPEVPEDVHWMALLGFVNDVIPVVQQALKEVGEVADR